jgi:hypothetical protein
MAAARGDAGDGGDVIGLERMLHAQQKPQPKNSEHTPPARLYQLKVRDELPILVLTRFLHANRCPLRLKTL